MDKLQILLVLPVYNEQECLEENVHLLYEYISEKKFFSSDFTILIADNGSYDNTAEIAKQLVDKYREIQYLRTDKKGRGHALKKAWNLPGYDYYMYMDADLAYSLNTIDKFIERFRQRQQIVSASRLEKSSYVERHWIRRFLTKEYNLLLKMLFFKKFSDAQAGCKAISKEVRDEVLPLVNDGGWFFDTHFLLEAERAGFSVYNCPVVCVDPREWRLSIISTVLYFLKKTFLLRLKFYKHSFLL